MHVGTENVGYFRNLPVISLFVACGCDVLMAGHDESCSCSLHDSGASQTLQVNRRDESRVSHFIANML